MGMANIQSYNNISSKASSKKISELFLTKLHEMEVNLVLILQVILVRQGKSVFIG